MRGIRLDGKTPPADWLKKAQEVTDSLYDAENTEISSATHMLSLQPGLTKKADIATPGTSHAVVAEVASRICIRIFDSSGRIIVDADQPKKDHEKSWFSQLAEVLVSNWDLSKLKPLEVKEVFRLCERISRRYLTSKIIERNEKLWKDDRIRNWLLSLFNDKCWYSEAHDAVSSYHVDHYRPKGRVTDDRSDNVIDGYWWLAFNWKNYRISGELLNVKKNDLFPYADLARAVHNDPMSIDKESPVLIDPLVEEEARLISYEWRDEETCVAVQAGGISLEQAERVERTIEILGLNRLARLNRKRAQLWDECRLAIADYQGAQGASNFARVEQAIATRTLKQKIKYDAEFSSVAEACVRKTAPEPLIAAVFAH